MNTPFFFLISKKGLFYVIYFFNKAGGDFASPLALHSLAVLSVLPFELSSQVFFRPLINKTDNQSQYALSKLDLFGTVDNYVLYSYMHINLGLGFVRFCR